MTISFTAMCYTGVYTLMRVGELCYLKQGGREKFIANKDVKIFQDRIEITIWKSKTDKNNKGVKKIIANLNTFTGILTKLSKK